MENNNKGWLTADAWLEYERKKKPYLFRQKPYLFRIVNSGLLQENVDFGNAYNNMNASGIAISTLIYLSINFIDANTGFACGASGTILKTTNGGTTWTAQTSGTTNQLNSIDFIDANTGFACGASGTILKTTNGGTTWTAQTSGTTNELNSISLSSTTLVLSCGASGTIRLTTNGGTTWTSQTSGTTNELNSIDFSDSNNAFSCGAGGVILNSTNGGKTWSAQTSGTTNNLNSVKFTSTDDGLLCGNSGTIIITANRGVTWTAQTSGTANNLNGIYFVNSNVAFTCGAGSTILTTTNGGTTWSGQITTTVTSPISGVTYGEFLKKTEFSPFIVSKVVIISTTARQMETPITVIYRDSNGKRKDEAMIPELDPYQSLTDRATINEEFTWDGYTMIRIRELLAGATVNIRVYPKDESTPLSILMNEGGGTPKTQYRKLPKWLHT